MLVGLAIWSAQYGRLAFIFRPARMCRCVSEELVGSNNARAHPAGMIAKWLTMKN